MDKVWPLTIRQTVKYGAVSKPTSQGKLKNGMEHT